VLIIAEKAARRASPLQREDGQVTLTEVRARQRRDTALFSRHLDDLRCLRRGYRKIHVIWDLAGCHTRDEVATY
jgi:hypothetical protein